MGQGCQVIFIRNAAGALGGTNEPEEPWWVITDREAFTSLGCKIVDVDLNKISKEEFGELLGKSDVVHFCGGCVLLLTMILQKSGIMPMLVEAVRKG